MSELTNLSEIFSELNHYREYLNSHPFHEELGISFNTDKDLRQKDVRVPSYNVDPNLQEALPAEIDDLIRLHYLTTARKVTTILEFGVGVSTAVFDHALSVNKKNYQDFVLANLRRANPFECHSIDNNQKWISHTRRNYNTDHTIFYYSPCFASTFADRFCTFYETLPNISPDLIYLDAPDQYSPTGNVNGISTSHPDRVPMAADILLFEHLLLPGTLIIVDGRTANARFLKSNLQRQWAYHHFSEFDQHFFELVEEPLGHLNKLQLDFCLGDQYFHRLKALKKVGWKA